MNYFLFEHANFKRWILMLCTGYFFLSLYLNGHASLSYDEFWFAQHIYQYLHHLPYRDFLPYKTVLGYYLLSLPMYFSHDWLAPLFYIKDEIALVNAIAMGIISVWMRRFFHPAAIVLTLVLIISNQLFLIHSSDLRVDMLSCWCAVFSILLVLSNALVWAGISLALGFLISQKVLWFLVATNCGLMATALYTGLYKVHFKQLLRFNSAVLLPIGLYIIVWAQAASLSLVLHNIFYDAYLQSIISWYRAAYFIYWNFNLINGPLLFLLWPLCFLAFSYHSISIQSKLFIFCYSSVLMLLLLMYQQPFPYFCIFFTPVFLCTYSSWFTEFLAAPKTILNLRIVLLLSLCSCLLTLLFVVWTKSWAYSLIAIIPISIYLVGRLPHLQTHKTFLHIFWIAFFVTGIFYPLVRFSMLETIINNSSQKLAIKMVNILLAEGGSYFAGTPLLYQRPQSIAGLKNLIDPQTTYLFNQDSEILPLLLPSLDLTPRSTTQVLTDLYREPVKLFVRTERVRYLPSGILQFLDKEYEPFALNIYLYAPTIKNNRTNFTVKFTGVYRVQGNGVIEIDHHRVIGNQIIKLQRGSHQTYSTSSYRLQFIPQSPSLMELRTQIPQKKYFVVTPVLF